MNGNGQFWLCVSNTPTKLWLSESCPCILNSQDHQEDLWLPESCPCILNGQDHQEDLCRAMFRITISFVTWHFPLKSQAWCLSLPSQDQNETRKPDWTIHYMRHLENMVQYQYDQGPIFNLQKTTYIHLYNNGNEFIYVYWVKILQNKLFLEKLVLPLKLLL